MPTKKYVNWKLALVLLIAIAVLGVTAFSLRQWQRTRRAESGLVRGSKAYDRHNWQEAADYLGRYLSINRDDVPVLLKYAQAQLNISPLGRANLRQAIEAYRHALRIDKNCSEAAGQLTQIYLQLGMPGEAELIAARCIENQKTAPQTSQTATLRRALALALARQRKFDEAVRELKSIVAEFPDQISSYELLGILAKQQPDKMTQSPEFWFDEAVKNNPAMAEAYIARAGHYFRQSAKSQALADIEEAERQDLSSPAVRLRLTELLIKLNYLDRAAKHLEAVYSIEPDNQLLWQIWAKLALKSGSRTEMIKIARTGLKEVSARPWEFMPIAAELYIRSDQLDKAQECIWQLRQKDIAPATTAFLEGLLADRKNDGYEAVKSWHRAIQLGSKSAHIRLALAATLSRLGDKQTAIKQLRSLVSEQPSLLDARLAIVRLLLELNNPNEAIEHTRTAIQLAPDSLNAHLLDTQAQIQLLLQNQTEDDAGWLKIEERLALLRKASDALPVKLLQLNLEIQRSRFATAQRLLADIKSNHPSSEDVLLAEAKLLIAQDKNDQAIQKLYDALNVFPKSARTVEMLAGLLEAQGSAEQCEKILLDASSRINQPDAARNLTLLLAGFYNRSGRQEKRYQLLNTFAEEFPNDVVIKRELLKCDYIINDPTRAQKLVDEIKAAEGPDGWQWRYEQAKLWYPRDDFKDRFTQIITLLQENLSANPDDQASRTLLAAAYERAGQLQLAISTWRQALNRSPKDIRIIVPTVSALYKAKEYDQADQILQQTANERLLHPELRKLEFQSYLRRGRLNSAADILEEMLANDPNDQSIRLALALIKIKQNNFTEADELLDKLKADEPNSLPVTVAQIELNSRQGKSAEALLLCDELVNETNSISAYILRARTLAALNQTDRTMEDLNHAVKLQPENADAWVARSDFYRSRGSFVDAAADIRKAISLAPANLQIQKRAVSLLLTSPDPESVNQGKNILDNALSSNPHDIELRLYKARSLLAEQSAPALKQASIILEKLTQDQPLLTEPWLLLTEIALRQGQSSKAMDIALRGLIHRPENKSLMLAKAHAEAQMSPALAIPTIKALYDLDPNNLNIVMRLADTYIAAGRPNDAIDLLQAKLDSCTGPAERRKMNIALAVALYKNGNKSQAGEMFDSLSASEPNDPATLLTRSRLLKDDKLYDKLEQKVLDWCRSHRDDTQSPIAIAGMLAVAEDQQAKKYAESILRTTLNNAPDCLEAMEPLAMLLQMTGRSTEAAELYRSLLAAEPDNAVVINNLAWILCEEQGKYHEALQLAIQGLENTPSYIDINYINLLDTRGMAYYRLGKLHEAIRDFNRCIELYPAQTAPAVSSYIHLGRALAELGEKDRAIEILKRGLKLNSTLGSLSSKDLADVQQLIENLSKGE